MKIRLYMDEDAMRAALVKALRSQGIDVITVQGVSRTGYSDEDQVLYATEQQRVIYSYNVKHYTALHTNFLEQNLSHGGIVVAKKDRYSIGEQMRRLSRLVNTLTTEEMQGRLEFLSSWG